MVDGRLSSGAKTSAPCSLVRRRTRSKRKKIRKWDTDSPIKCTVHGGKKRTRRLLHGHWPWPHTRVTLNSGYARAILIILPESLYLGKLLVRLRGLAFGRARGTRNSPKRFLRHKVDGRRMEIAECPHAPVCPLKAA